jgi:hypothetical protein
VRRVDQCFLHVGLYGNSKNSTGRLDEELLMERGLYPGVETSVIPDEVDTVDAVGGV